MAEDKEDIGACECFSLQFDESTDMVDVAQLCVERATHDFAFERI